MTKKIAGEMFFRDAHPKKKGKRHVMVVGVLEIDDDEPFFQGETFYYVTGFTHEGTPLLLVHEEGKEFAGEKHIGEQINHVMVDHKWRLPQLKTGQYIGKPTLTQIEKDYF